MDPSFLVTYPYICQYLATLYKRVLAFFSVQHHTNPEYLWKPTFRYLIYWNSNICQWVHHQQGAGIHQQLSLRQYEEDEERTQRKNSWLFLFHIGKHTFMYMHRYYPKKHTPPRILAFSMPPPIYAQANKVLVKKIENGRYREQVHLYDMNHIYLPPTNRKKKK